MVVFGVGNDIVVVVVGVVAMPFTAAASAVVVAFGELVTGTEIVAAVGEVATALDKLAHGFDTGNKPHSVSFVVMVFFGVIKDVVVVAVGVMVTGVDILLPGFDND